MTQKAQSTVQARVLHAAARRVGGEQRLAEALQVPSTQLAYWLSGLQVPPRRVLLRALAILLDRSGTAKTLDGAA